MNTLSALSNVLAAESSQGSPLGILILLLPIAAIFWLFIGPQRKQKARQQQLMSTLSVGDEVLTNGGIVGTITFIEDDLVHLEVDHDVVIRVAKSAVSGSTSQPDPAQAPRRRGGLLGGLTGGTAASAASADSDADADTDSDTDSDSDDADTGSDSKGNGLKKN